MTLPKAVSDAVCKEMGPILEVHANRISQQELSYRTDKKVRIYLHTCILKQGPDSVCEHQQLSVCTGILAENAYKNF